MSVSNANVKRPLEPEQSLQYMRQNNIMIGPPNILLILVAFLYILTATYSAISHDFLALFLNIFSTAVLLLVCNYRLGPTVKTLLYHLIIIPYLLLMGSIVFSIYLFKTPEKYGQIYNCSFQGKLIGNIGLTIFFADNMLKPTSIRFSLILLIIITSSLILYLTSKYDSNKSKHKGQKSILSINSQNLPNTSENPTRMSKIPELVDESHHSIQNITESADSHNSYIICVYFLQISILLPLMAYAVFFPNLFKALYLFSAIFIFILWNIFNQRLFKRIHIYNWTLLIVLILNIFLHSILQIDLIYEKLKHLKLLIGLIIYDPYNKCYEDSIELIGRPLHLLHTCFETFLVLILSLATNPTFSGLFDLASAYSPTYLFSYPLDNTKAPHNSPSIEKANRQASRLSPKKPGNYQKYSTKESEWKASLLFIIEFISDKAYFAFHIAIIVISYLFIYAAELNNKSKVWSILFHSYVSLVFFVPSLLLICSFDPKKMLHKCSIAISLIGSIILVMNTSIQIYSNIVYEKHYRHNEIHPNAQHEIGLTEYKEPLPKVRLNICSCEVHEVFTNFSNCVNNKPMQSICEYNFNGLLIQTIFVALFWISDSFFAAQRLNELNSQAEVVNFVANKKNIDPNVHVLQSSKNPQIIQPDYLIKTIFFMIEKFVENIWIYFCSFLFIYLATRRPEFGEISLVQLSYMILFLINILILGLSFRLWLSSLFSFYAFVLVYLCLILFYVYIVKLKVTSRVPELQQSVTYFFGDDAIEQSVSQVLLGPALFTVALSFQLKFLNKNSYSLDFLNRLRTSGNKNAKINKNLKNPQPIDNDQISNQHRSTGDSQPVDVHNRLPENLDGKSDIHDSEKAPLTSLHMVVVKLQLFIIQLISIIIQICRILFPKLTLILLAFLISRDISLYSAVYIVCLFLFAILPIYEFFWQNILLFLLSIDIIAKMIVQLSFISITSNQARLFLVMCGLEKNKNLMAEIILQVSILVLIVLYRIIRILALKESLLFPPLLVDPNYKDSVHRMKNLENFYNFLINAFLYKFMKDIFFISLVVIGIISADIFGILFLVVVIISIFLSQKILQKSTIVYTVLFLALNLINYSFYVSIVYNKECQQINLFSPICSKINEIYLLTNFDIPTKRCEDRLSLIKNKFFLHLLTLVLASSFNFFLFIEQSPALLSKYNLTKNDALSPREFNDYSNLEIEDFLVAKTSLTVVLQRIIFKYFFWILLMSILISSSVKENLFGIFYLMIGSGFLYFGTSIFTKKYQGFVNVFKVILCLFILLAVTQIAIIILLQDIYLAKYPNIVNTFFDTECLINSLENATDDQPVNSLMNPESNNATNNDFKLWNNIYRFFIKYSGTESAYRMDTSAIDIMPIICMILFVRSVQSNYFRHFVIEQKALELLPSHGVEFVNKREFERFQSDGEMEEEIMKEMTVQYQRCTNGYNVPAIHYEYFVRSANETYFKDAPMIVVPLLKFTKETKASSNAKRPITLNESDNEESEKASKSFCENLKHLITKCLDSFSSYIDLHFVDYFGIQKMLDKELAKKKFEICNSNQQIANLDSAIGHVANQPSTDGENPVNNLVSHACTSVYITDPASKNSFVRFLTAIYKSVAFNLGNICFLLVILLQITSRGFITFPLLLLIFIWGGLSVPMPYSRFWRVLIFAVIFVILVLNLYDISLALVPDRSKMSNKLVYFLGFHQTNLTKSVASILLVMLFVNKYVNKSFGMWQKLESNVGEIFDRRKLANAGFRDSNAPLVHSNAHLPATANELPRSFQTSPRPTSYDSIPDPALEARIAAAAPLTSTRRGRAPELLELRVVDDAVEVTVRDQNQSPLLLQPENGLQESLPQNSNDSNILLIFNTNGNENSNLNQDFERDPNAYSNRTALSNDQKQSKSKLLERISSFAKNLVSPRLNSTSDLYGPMMLLIFLAIFIVLIFFKDFSPISTDGDIIKYFSRNYIPIAFLYLIIIHFVVVLFDRAIFLKKWMKLKIIFYLIVLFGSSIYVFAILPSVNFNSYTKKRNWATSIWFCFICIYLLISSCQIRRGYPNFSIRYFYQLSYGYKTLILYYIYLYTPFVHIIRCTLDWTLLPSSMSLSHFITMEDIYIMATINKCFREIGGRNFRRINDPYSKNCKCFCGCAIIIILFCVIIFPLVFFTPGNPFFQPSPINNCTIELSFEGYPMFLSISTSHLEFVNQQIYARNIKTGKTQGIEDMDYKKDQAEGEDPNEDIKFSEFKIDSGFLQNFNPSQDVQLATFYTSSFSYWNITNSALEEIKYKLRCNNRICSDDLPDSSNSLEGNPGENGESDSSNSEELSENAVDLKSELSSINISYKVSFVKDQKVTDLDTKLIGKRAVTLEEGLRIIKWIESTESSPESVVKLESILPLAIHIEATSVKDRSSSISQQAGSYWLKKNPAEASETDQENATASDKSTKFINNTIISLFMNNYPTDLFDYSSNLLSNPLSSSGENTDGKPIVKPRVNPVKVLIFNDRVASNIVSIPAQYGIIGLYLSFVFIIERLVRVYWFDREQYVIYNEECDIDPILDICYQLYLAREHADFALESFCLSKLLFLHQNPSFKHDLLVGKLNKKDDEQQINVENEDDQKNG